MTDECISISLPKITNGMWDSLSETSLMTWDRERNQPQWTQDAVDFVCLLNGVMKTKAETIKLNQQELADKWVPEVGQECEAQIYPNGREPFEWCRAEVLKVNHNELNAVLVGDSLYWSANLRPIQTEADTYRDEQIEKLDSLIVKFNFPQPKTMAVRMHDLGRVRVLQPNQFVANELTERELNYITELMQTTLMSPRDVLNEIIDEMNKVQP